MLGLTHLDFLAPDTSTVVVENLFDAAPVFIPKSKILAYKWDFGDTLIRVNSKQINHSYENVGVYKVKMNVVYQVDSTKGIYEQNVSKNIVVLSPEDFLKRTETKNLKEHYLCRRILANIPRAINVLLQATIQCVYE